MILFFTAWLIIGLIFSVIGGAGWIEWSPNTRTESVTGTVTKITESTHTNSTTRNNSLRRARTSTYCTFGYEFTVDGKQYTNIVENGSSANCNYTEGMSVAIKYNPTNPADSQYDGGSSKGIFAVFFAIGLTMVVVGIIGGIVMLKYGRRDDADDDGLGGDNLPATAAQLTLIQNGFRELGQFYTPHAMTRADARETLAEIERQRHQRSKSS